MPHQRHAHKNISGQRTRASRAMSYLWKNTTFLPLKYAPCTRHTAHATYDTCDKRKRQRQHFVDDEHSSRHTCPQQRCELTCVSCSKLATRGTQMDARNSKRRHERCSRAPQHDVFLESGSLRQPCHERLRPNTTSYPKNTTDKEPEITCFTPRLILVQPLNVSSDVARSCTIRESTKQDRARQSTRAPFPHITTNTKKLK